MEIIKKRRLNMFLRKYINSTQAQAFPPSKISNFANTGNNILNLLQLGQFQEAIKAAITEKQPIVANLISKIFCSGINFSETDTVKEEIGQLLLNYRNEEQDQFIDVKVLQIYTLLAGFPQFELSNGLIIDNCSNLNWIQLFAHACWFYGSSSNFSIAAIFEKFTELRSELNLTAASPMRNYGQNRKHPAFYLLEFFCYNEKISLNQVLDNYNFSSTALAWWQKDLEKEGLESPRPRLEKEMQSIRS